jgi:hypothetical protein
VAVEILLKVELNNINLTSANFMRTTIFAHVCLPLIFRALLIWEGMAQSKCVTLIITMPELSNGMGDNPFS